MEKISVVEKKPQLVAGMSRRGPYKQIPIMMRDIFTYLISKGAKIAGPPMFICHEKSEEEAIEAEKRGDADVEIAVPLAEKVEETGEIKCYELPGGKMAKIIHKGPYEECKPTYDALFSWIKENKKQITGFIREVYLNDPSTVTKEEILTEIFAPIE